MKGQEYFFSEPQAPVITEEFQRKAIIVPFFQLKISRDNEEGKNIEVYGENKYSHQEHKVLEIHYSPCLGART